MNKAIYTVLIGNYDTLLPAPKFNGWDAILFTDQELQDYKGWRVEKLPKELPLGNKKTSREIKILSHKWLLNYDIVCYIDANIELLKEPTSDPVFFSHYLRRNIASEINTLIKLKLENPSVLRIQYHSYRKAGFKDNLGLYACGFFVRSNRDEKINKLFESWFDEVEHHSYRDQISLPYVLWKNNIRLPTKPYSVARQYIRIHPHQPHSINVHHITPGRSDKNFGKAINDIVKLLPDEDWVCLRDIDTIPMNHEQFFIQCEEIAKKNEYGLVGCITNRLGLKWQLHGGVFSEVMDMMKHRNIAVELTEKYGSEVCRSMNSIGGLFMLFPKSTWIKVGGFPEGSIMIKGRFIDYAFWESVKKSGIKVGIAKGIYMFHAYRMGKDKRDIKHLI